ncbi:MAG: DUF3795 domain-containing protein [Actinobacteria bacterium]|nr:DUF3795 domain-containing protein [Actinomycetota bacterium]
MAEMQVTPELVASCGLYCGACKSYLRGKCQGCHQNVKATWCKIRSCCGDQGIQSCASCSEYPDPMTCRKFNNFMAKVFRVVFRSDRAACIDQIKQLGLEGHARAMAARGSQTIKR